MHDQIGADREREGVRGGQNVVLLGFGGKEFDASAAVILAFGPQRLAIVQLVSGQRRAMRVIFAATPTLKRFLFAVLSMMGSQFGRIGKPFSALAAIQRLGEGGPMLGQFRRRREHQFADGTMARIDGAHRRPGITTR